MIRTALITLVPIIHFIGYPPDFSRYDQCSFIFRDIPSILYPVHQCVDVVCNLVMVGATRPHTAVIYRVSDRPNTRFTLTKIAIFQLVFLLIDRVKIAGHWLILPNTITQSLTRTQIQFYRD